MRLFWEKYFNPRLGFRAQIFNALGFIGVALGIVAAAFNAVNRAGPANVAVNLAVAGLAVALLRYANSPRPGAARRFRRCFMVVVAAVFLVAFPVLFFTAGGYHSGMPSFFVFAVAFTVFMLEGRLGLWMAGLEIALYGAICLAAYWRPQWVTPFPTESATARDIIGGTLLACAALAAAIHRHIILYDQKQARLEAFDRQKTELLGNVSHELKMPLAAISLQAQALRARLERLPGAEGVGDALLIAAEAERMSLMVGQVLVLACIEEGRMVWDKRPCHADEIIYAAIQTHFPILNRGNNRLEIKTEPGLPLVLADAQRVAQVVVNLTVNALRHTEGGLITLWARRAEGAVAITVQDTGEGIPQAELPFVFDRYRTGGGPRDTGTGLGLYICKEIVEAHGGTITIESEPGRGTVATFTLPAAPS
jgi:signal transduction histidine kinase